MSGVITDLVVVEGLWSVGAGLRVQVAPGSAVVLWGGDDTTRAALAAVLTGRRRATYGAMACATCDDELEPPRPLPRAPRCWRGRTAEHLTLLTDTSAPDVAAALARETSAGRSVIALVAGDRPPAWAGDTLSAPLREMRISAPTAGTRR